MSTTKPNPTRRDMIDLIWKREPAFATSFFPKRWQMPPGVYSPEEFLPPLYAQFEIFQSEHVQARDVCNTAWVALGASLHDFGTRVYRIERELIKSLQLTTLRGFTFEGVALPLPAFLVTFPEGALTLEQDGDVLGLGINLRDDHFVVTAPLASGATYTFTSPASDIQLEDILARSKVQYQRFDDDTERMLEHNIEGYKMKFGSSPETDADELHQILLLSLNMIAYMSMRSDEEQELTSIKRKRKRGKFDPQRDREFYHPFVIGERYARGVRSGSSPRTGTTGRNVRLHWRAGHWRRQRFGKGRELIKLIHIEPVLVGAGS